VPFEEVLEGFQDVFALAFRHEDGTFILEVNKGRDVLVAPLSGRFIDADGGDVRKVLFLDGLVDVMMGDPPLSVYPTRRKSGPLRPRA
jgi:hypothetical protein